ncbi:hypothetical protein MPDQ_004056 [Monascus purpureus]|uniref:Uncharacterized protein n=1 Tax=Monascus purpureus TaxID=5098 RepID=A0A507QHS3_MONPU|nr:hypothetical protein MPDQ_004056 [Monascus purpureus]BDD55971.1 hypothetical protein MAP00_001451 [Monascus purpureus]
MTNGLFNYDDETCQSWVIDPRDEDSQYPPPTPGNFGRTPCTVSSLSPTPDPTYRQTQSNDLGFLPYDEWKRRKDNNCEDLGEQDLIYHTIAWKLKINRTTEAKETEQDLVVAPSEYWAKCLKQKIDALMHAKKRNRRVRFEDVEIVVSINHRNEGPLEKRSDDTNIDWRPVETKLRKWSNLVRMGRTPQIAITVKYMRDDDAAKAYEKRGSSATKRMLAERDAAITAEEESSQPSSWRYVYKLMRCSVTSCSNFDKWCWQDLTGRKHYGLRKAHLMKLIAYVDAGGKLDSHDDVPEGIRQALYVEAQQKLERGLNKTNHQVAFGAPCPININLLAPQGTHESAIPLSPPRPAISKKKIKISGPRDDAVRAYCEWHELQVTDEKRKADWRKACEITLSNGLDLELVEEDQEHVQFLIEQGVTKGTARRFVRDIPEWVEHVRELSSEGCSQGAPDCTDD